MFVCRKSPNRLNLCHQWRQKPATGHGNLPCTCTGRIESAFIIVEAEQGPTVHCKVLYQDGSQEILALSQVWHDVVCF